jgi:hypothetical protein
MADEIAKKAMDGLATTLAISDAWHDFHTYSCDPTAILESGIKTFNESVIEPYPEGGSKPSEDVVLGSVSDTSIRTTIDAAPGTLSQFTTRSNVTFISKVISLDAADNTPVSGSDIAVSANLPPSFGVIVDFNQHGILGRFVAGPSAGKTCYYLYTSETENDPAGKTSSKDGVFTPKESGIRLIYCEQTGGNPIAYTGASHFEPGNHDYKLDFYSKYTLTLSPIQRITTLGIGKKTTVNLTISNDGNTLVHQIADAKKANSIKSIVSEFMKKIIRGPWNVVRKFDANAGWIQKRSGDWLQVLACLDVHNREFNPPLPKGTPIFFVTHDRVALSYALLMGVNTIFIKPDHKIIVFTRADAAQQDINEIYANQVASIQDGPRVYKWLKDFQTMRNEQLAKWSGLLESRTELHLIIEAVLHYTHTYLEIQDVSGLLSALSRFNNLGERIIETENSKVIAAYVSAVSIMKVHIEPKFRDVFDSNFKRKDVFDSLRRSLLPYSVGRLITMATGSVDKYSFLGYINKLPDEDMKRRFIGRLGRYEQNPPTALTQVQKDLLSNAMVLISTRALFEGSAGLDIPAVVEAHSFNDDPNNDERNHSPDQADVVEGTGGRRKTRRGGWTSGFKYTPTGATVIFPIKQTTQGLVVAHILRPPAPSLLQRFGLVGIQRFQDIAVTDDVVTEVGEDPGQYQFGGAKPDEHLFPIYAMLDAFTPNICERLEGSMDMEHYNRYYAFLEALKRRSEAITDPLQKDLIAMALREVLFISAQSEAGRVSILSCVGETVENYAITASMTTTFSNYMCGELSPYTTEYEKGVSGLLKDTTVMDVIGGAWKDSASFRNDMTVSELDSAVEKLKLDLVSVLTRTVQGVSSMELIPTQVDKVVPDVPIKSLTRSESIGDPMPFSLAGRRRTRRLTNDFLQSVRHQSIKMSSRRHSLSGKPFKR